MIRKIRFKNSPPVSVLIKNPEEHIQKHWMKGRYYECQRNGLLPYIARHYTGGLIVDVGASIGNHTLFFASVCRARVFAFEPYRPSYRHLQANVRLNGFHGNGRITTANVALGNHRGKVSMKAVDKRNVGMIQVAGEDGDIPLAPLDDLIRPPEVPMISFIKIDVEHYNRPVLEGMKNTLRYYSPDLSIEAENRDQYREVRGILRQMGYRPLLNSQGRALVFNHTPTYVFSKNKR